MKENTEKPEGQAGASEDDSGFDRTASLSPSERASRGSAPRTPARISELDRTRSAGEPGDGAVDDEGLIAGNPDRYEYAGEHARGGLGRVVKARDKSLRRTVAIKELLKDSQAAEARFVREAMVTARLEHPAIVPVHEAGRWPSGDPYYVMKLISGRTLKDMARSRKGLQDRLTLLPNAIAVAEAIAYAHSQGVIHRDLKPANVVVGEFGETVVVDWGLAKDMRAPVEEEEAPSGELSVSGEHTVAGDVLGTPAYMPPEQARGDEVDERADVFALGSILYEMLAGRPPYSGVESGQIIARVLEGPPEPLDDLRSNVPPDLLAIVHKATAREPDARYPTAKELAEDLKRFQTGQLVSAHSYSAAALARRWLWRHRAVVGVTVVCLAILAVIAVVSVQRVVRERNVAEDQREQAERRGHALVFHQAKTSLPRDPTATVAWLKTYPVDGPEFGKVTAMLDEARAKGVARHVFRHGDWVRSVAFTPDGKHLATACQDGIVRVWDVEAGTARVLGQVDLGFMAVAVSRDGKLLATGGSDGAISVWGLASGDRRDFGRRSGPAYVLAFSADASRLFTYGDGKPLGIWDVAAGKPAAVKAEDLRGAVASADGSTVVSGSSEGEIFVHHGDFTEKRGLGKLPSLPQRGQISEDGALAAVHCVDGMVRVIDTEEGVVRELGRREGRVDSLTFSRDGRRLATAGDDGVARVWDITSGEVVVLRGHEDAIYMAAFSPDGSLLVTAGDDATARVWDLATGDVQVLRGHTDDVVAVVFAPDGTTLATASLDSSVRVWSLGFDDARVLLGGGTRDNLLRRSGVGRTPRGALGHLVLTPDGRTAVTLAQDGELRNWDMESGESRVVGQSSVRYKIVPHRPPVSPDGRYVATPGKESTIELWDVASGEHHALSAHQGWPGSLTFSPDSQVLLSAGADGRVLLWDLATRQPSELVHAEAALAAAFSAQGDRIAVVSLTEVSVWDVASRDKVATLDQVEDTEVHNTRQAVFAPNGEWLLVPGWKFGIQLWNLTTGEMRTLATAPFHVTDVAFCPNSGFLAAAGGDRIVYLWNLSTGKRTLLRGHTDLLMQLAFSPDSSVLASASYDKTIRLWNTRTGEARVLRGHAASVDTLAFTPDGASLVSGSRDSTVRVWSLDRTHDSAPAAVTVRMDELTSAVIGGEDCPFTPVHE